MQFNIKSNNLTLNSQLQQEFKQKVRNIFARTRQKISGITVTLSDINGPRGGKDKQCKVKLNLPGAPVILVIAREDNLRKAFSSALSRANQTLKRKLKKQQTLQKQALITPLPPQLAFNF